MLWWPAGFVVRRPADFHIATTANPDRVGCNSARCGFAKVHRKIHLNARLRFSAEELGHGLKCASYRAELANEVNEHNSFDIRRTQVASRGYYHSKCK